MLNNCTRKEKVALPSSFCSFNSFLLFRQIQGFCNTQFFCFFTVFIIFSILPWFIMPPPPPKLFFFHIREVFLSPSQSFCSRAHDSYSCSISHKITISFIFHVLSTTCPANKIVLWNPARAYKISNAQGCVWFWNIREWHLVLRLLGVHLTDFVEPSKK